MQPVAQALGGPGHPLALDRAAIIAVGAIMAIKWLIAWLSYLPRRAERAVPA